MSEEELRSFTKTEQRILLLLQDGEPHTRWNIRNEIGDEYTSLQTIQMHISRIRRKLAAHRKSVLCEQSNGEISYRLVDFVRA